MGKDRNNNEIVETRPLNCDNETLNNWFICKELQKFFLYGKTGYYEENKVNA
jgi:hypothetical protein